MYKSQIQQEIKNLEKELGIKTEYLVTAEPYIHLTPANQERYEITQNEIEEIEKNLEIKNRILDRLDTEMDYDDHLGTGMDTSMDINEYEDNTKNE